MSQKKAFSAVIDTEKVVSTLEEKERLRKAALDRREIDLGGSKISERIRFLKATSRRVISDPKAKAEELELTRWFSEYRLLPEKEQRRLDREYNPRRDRRDYLRSLNPEKFEKEVEDELASLTATQEVIGTDPIAVDLENRSWKLADELGHPSDVIVFQASKDVEMDVAAVPPNLIVIYEVKEGPHLPAHLAPASGSRYFVQLISGDLSGYEAEQLKNILNGLYRDLEAFGPAEVYFIDLAELGGYWGIYRGLRGLPRSLKEELIYAPIESGEVFEDWWPVMGEVMRDVEKKEKEREERKKGPWRFLED